MHAPSLMGPILGFMAAAYFFGRLIYWLVIDREVPGGWERRFGMEEPLPPDIGQWRTDEASEEGQAAARSGLKREVRLFHDPHRRGSQLISQVRYRSVATNAISRTEPDIPVHRRRIRP